jgi:uncharacterized protein (TIGR02466 family)
VTDVSGPRMTPLFWTPVITDALGDADELNASLSSAILAQRERDQGLKLSNRGGWQSRRDFPRWGGPAGRQVTDHAISLASAHTVVNSAGNAPPWSVDVWANVSGSGNFNMPHIHGGSFWSCVYYVQLGEGTGGQLVLHDPRMPGLRMHAPGVRFKGIEPEVRAVIEPKPGLMVLFPAWLSHSVEPWEGNGNRISMAMNIRVANARS